MFDVNDEIDELIDCYNESVELNYAIETYNAIFDELQNRVNSGELTLEDAEILNDLAYDKYVNESTRYAREIYKKHKELPEDAPLSHKWEIEEQDTLKWGKECRGRGLIEQEDIGRSRKQRQPGYHEGRPNHDEPEKNGMYLKRQIMKDSKNGVKRNQDDLEKAKKLALKHRNEEVIKNNDYYKNHNHGKCNYSQKNPRWDIISKG